MRKVHEVLYPYAAAEPEKIAESCHVLARLIDGKPLDSREYWSEKKRAEQQWDWAPAIPRSIHPGQTVRVKQDAYDEKDTRHWQNGRIGMVAGIRRGVVVTYTEGASTGYQHDLDKLERQVPIQPERRGRT